MNLRQYWSRPRVYYGRLFLRNGEDCVVPPTIPWLGSHEQGEGAFTFYDEINAWLAYKLEGNGRRGKYLLEGANIEILMCRRLFFATCIHAIISRSLLLIIYGVPILVHMQSLQFFTSTSIAAKLIFLTSQYDLQRKTVQMLGTTSTTIYNM